MKPRCFVVEPTKVSLNSARQFGDLLYMFDENTSRPSLFDSGLGEALRVRFVELDFDPLKDFFVVAGDNIAITRAAAVLGELCGNFQMLVWSKRTTGYIDLTNFEFDTTT